MLAHVESVRRVSRLTVVECLQFVAGDFGALHAPQQGLDSSIFFAPEVVRNYTPCQELLVVHSEMDDFSQDKDTVGASATMPGIAPAVSDGNRRLQLPRVAYIADI